MEEIKFKKGVKVFYKGKEYEISSVNKDGTIRLKCDDVNHENYSNGSIGCYHPYDLYLIKN